MIFHRGHQQPLWIDVQEMWGMLTEPIFHPAIPLFSTITDISKYL